MEHSHVRYTQYNVCGRDQSLNRELDMIRSLRHKHVDQQSAVTEENFSLSVPSGFVWHLQRVIARKLTQSACDIIISDDSVSGTNQLRLHMGSFTYTFQAGDAHNGPASRVLEMDLGGLLMSKYLGVFISLTQVALTLFWVERPKLRFE